jgi:glycolate dehydrogenase FAD-linked subunit
MASSEELERLVNQCVKCGLCLPWCPVYQKMLMEEASPRGRVQLAKRFLHAKQGEKIRPSKELSRAFYTCTSCNACSSFCPSQIKPGEVIQEGREKIFSEGGVPEAVGAVKTNILKTTNAYGGKKEDRTSIYPPSVREKLGMRKKGHKADTLLFLGCVASYLDMRIIPSFIKIMDAAGVGYTLLASEELCCGLPLYLMGDKETFSQNAAQVASLIRETGAKELVTPCAGCYKSFRKHYPEVVKMDLAIYHSSQYINRLIEGKAIRFAKKGGQKMTYHDPCDLGRSFQIFEEPRAVLKAIVGDDLVEMEKNRIMARCCGGGGSMLALGPELAADMATLRVKDAAEVGAEIIVSGCSTCKDNLRKGVKAIPKGERPKIKVMDITEVVADSIG